MMDLFKKLDTRDIVRLSKNDLDAVLMSCETLREQDTCMSGTIRILGIENRILVQEQTPQGDYLIREMASVEDANAFVDDRLETYDRMWDGCGCKIDYFD